MVDLAAGLAGVSLGEGARVLRNFAISFFNIVFVAKDSVSGFREPLQPPIPEGQALSFVLAHGSPGPER